MQVQDVAIIVRSWGDDPFRRNPAGVDRDPLNARRRVRDEASGGLGAAAALRDVGSGPPALQQPARAQANDLGAQAHAAARSAGRARISPATRTRTLSAFPGR